MNTRAELLRELDNTDRRMRELISDLDDAQLAVPYERGINPPIWELGHAAFFTEYFLLRVVGDDAPRMPGYDEIWDAFQIPHRVRWQEGVVPDRRATLDYYTSIMHEVRARLEAREPGPEEHYLCRYSICHQNMHVESMIWCRQTLEYAPPPGATMLEREAAAAPDGDAQIPGGSYPIGLSKNRGFGFDNERPGFRADVEPFAISKRLVTNGEFLAFVEDKGYETPSLWSFPGRCWLEEEKAAHPLYWRRDKGGAWQQRRFDRWTDLAPDAPVLHVSYWEAEAYASWAGRRLPTEREWEAAARGPSGRLFAWGDAMDAARVDMDGTKLATGAVDSLREGATPEGCLQMLGTAWEWTSSQFLPYDGFKVDMYPFMSTLQFGDHKVTKGGSCATSSCLIRNTYRQAYLPGRRDAFTGFRTCAR